MSRIGVSGRPELSGWGWRAATALCAGLVLAAPVRAVLAQGENLYGALILATNADHPAEPPPPIREQAENLRDVFGYNQFRLLGEARRAVPSPRENWEVDSRRFSLHVDACNPVPNGYALGLQLFHEKKMLVAADVKLSRASPLFIRGPMVGQGQLIIVLIVL